MHTLTDGENAILEASWNGRMAANAIEAHADQRNAAYGGFYDAWVRACCTIYGAELGELIADRYEMDSTDWDRARFDEFVAALVRENEMVRIRSVFYELDGFSQHALAADLRSYWRGNLATRPQPVTEAFSNAVGNHIYQGGHDPLYARSSDILDAIDACFYA
jgi:hypothetical protein